MTGQSQAGPPDPAGGPATATATARYDVTHRTTYRYSAPVAVANHLLHLAPAEFSRPSLSQSVARFELDIAPQPDSHRSLADYFGNRLDVIGLEAAHEQFIVTGRSTVSLTQSAQLDLSASLGCGALREMLRGSPHPEHWQTAEFLEASELIPDIAPPDGFAADLFGDDRPVLEAAMALTSRIFEDFDYDPAATDISTPLHQVFEQRRGVCQDFAHIGIALLRRAGLAARYVSGYLRTIPPPGTEKLRGADASHAWISVWAGPDLDWVDFDPTNNVLAATDHVTLAWGRDFSDVSPIRGVILGGGEHHLDVAVDVDPVDAGAQQRQTQQAGQHQNQSPISTGEDLSR